MKDLKKLTEEQKPEMTRAVGDVQKLVERERHNADVTTQQLVNKLRRTASDSQIRYKRVKYSSVASYSQIICESENSIYRITKCPFCMASSISANLLQSPVCRYVYYLSLKTLNSNVDLRVRETALERRLQDYRTKAHQICTRCSQIIAV